MKLPVIISTLLLAVPSTAFMIPPGPGNCTTTCRWEGFCGSDNQCHLYSCTDWYRYGPPEYSGHDGTVYSDLSCQDGVDTNVLAFEAYCIDRDEFREWRQEFTRQCLAQNSQNKFVCLEMANDTELSLFTELDELDSCQHENVTIWFRYFLVISNQTNAGSVFFEDVVFNETLARATMRAELADADADDAALKQNLMGMMIVAMSTLVLL